jgi:O-acetyl-ADP-ribose deacetylase (regulator of RNase III)
MLYEIKGNLLDSKEDFICHQVNCQGAMNSGVAKQIREKWPEVYREYSEFSLLNSKLLLGRIQQVTVNNNQSIVNMFSQEYYGYDGKRYTSYDAFWSCLYRIKADCGSPGATFAFPAKIGSDRGGANWNVIKSMINEVLGKDYDVYIYEYNGGK